MNDIERLLNPAFCSLLLEQFIDVYVQKVKRLEGSKAVIGVGLSLISLILPLVLTKRGLDAIMKYRDSEFALYQITREHPEILIRLDYLVNGYWSATQDAILYGCYKRLFRFEGTRLMSLRTGRYQDSELPLGIRRHVVAVACLGLWFAQVPVSEVFNRFKLYP